LFPATVLLLIVASFGFATWMTAGGI